MNTPWTETVDRQSPLPEYPRPQMVRRDWMSLNGEWEYAISDSKVIPERFDGTIIVPFSPETELSGVGRALAPGQYLWYRREISLPESFAGNRLLLHFGAVDQVADLWVNEKHAATHIGGYLPFEADVTISPAEKSLSLVVRVTDDTDRGFHTRGKQKTKRGGIWYTPQSGIWQSVWIEAVPLSYVRALRITPFFDYAEVDISADVVGKERAFAHFDGKSYELPASIPVPGFEAWSPEHPKLYEFTVTCGDDEVKSYFAMRKFSVEKDDKGVPRLFLNNAPYFHNGLLDQGYWPDGLYTPPTDEAMVFDIQTAKDMGFNMLRKHVKIECARWYYHCDRIGMVVWQDMINGGGPVQTLLETYLPTIFPAIGNHLRDDHYGLLAREDEKARKRFERDLLRMIRQLGNHPCIGQWVPFNEGWGQFDALRITDRIKKEDPTRPVDHASGWFDQGGGDVRSVHNYFRPLTVQKESRAFVISEYGGINCQIEGHTMNEEVYGYHTAGVSDFPQQFADKMAEIRALEKEGLCGAVYTQVSDVEEETNGLLTYDRKVCKVI